MQSPYLSLGSRQYLSKDRGVEGLWGRNRGQSTSKIGNSQVGGYHRGYFWWGFKSFLEANSRHWN